jgi:hypothetical protein
MAKRAQPFPGTAAPWRAEVPRGGCRRLADRVLAHVRTSGGPTGPAQPVFRRPRSSPPLSFCSSLTRSNRRGTDPYARWCGRGDAARRPPIPIHAHSACGFKMESHTRGVPGEECSGKQPPHSWSQIDDRYPPHARLVWSCPAARSQDCGATTELPGGVADYPATRSAPANMSRLGSNGSWRREGRDLEHRNVASSSIAISANRHLGCQLGWAIKPRCDGAPIRRKIISIGPRIRGILV